MIDEFFKEYVESRLPRPEDRELLAELLRVFNETGKEGLKKHLADLIDRLEEG